MKIILADLQGQRGLVNKDTIAGGYGSRMLPFSKVTRVCWAVKKRYSDFPSIQMAYLAAIAAQSGHEVVWTRGDQASGDIALVLSSLVDYRQETQWADTARANSIRVGFVGLAASKMPELFAPHSDFILQGEPESAMQQLMAGTPTQGTVNSPPVGDLDTLPFPRWDLLEEQTRLWRQTVSSFIPRQPKFLFQGSRSCPEFCTYCPHRILAGYRARSVQNIINELEQLCDQYPFPYIVFRDPLFTEHRERCLELCDEILSRQLRFQFECETRLDHLDEPLLGSLYSAGLRSITFGVESASTETLRNVGRRGTMESHQRAIIGACSRRGIETRAFYVFGFLQDDWKSISATIDFSISLGSTFAQFKMLTPYPGTPLWKQIAPLVFEKDWEKFDGFTPVFHHPMLSVEELRFLMGAAYTRFYMRPSYLANFMQIQNERIRELVRILDQKTMAHHARMEHTLMSRTVTC